MNGGLVKTELSFSASANLGLGTVGIDADT
jgi:hypothetical protein